VVAGAVVCERTVVAYIATKTARMRNALVIGVRTHRSPCRNCFTNCSRME
jgi:hypothetical protein